MGIWDGIKHQFIEVIEWTEPADDILVFRFPVANHEIKNGAELTVRESQLALLVDQGQPADVFTAGLHTLSTENLPILTKLESWAHGFNSPFKSEVYFFSVRQKLGQKWGTRQPITVRDAEFGSVQLRMFGVHSYHLVDAPKFYREVSGTRERFTTEDLADQLLATIVSTAATTFAQSNVPFLDLAASLQTLSATLRAALAAPFAALGLALDSFVVESVSLPSALEQALQTRQAIGIVGNLQTYAQYQAAKSIPDAAQNPSGVAGLGAGVAVGAGIGQVMGRALGGIGLQPSAAAPTSEPTAAGTNRQPSAADAGSAAGAAAPQPSAAPALVPCSACAKAIEPGSGFCRFCGQPQKLVCPGCHKDVAPGSAFCSGCGHKLGA